jgi:hypothetical protein
VSFFSCWQVRLSSWTQQPRLWPNLLPPLFLLLQLWLGQCPTSLSTTSTRKFILASLGIPVDHLIEGSKKCVTELGPEAVGAVKTLLVIQAPHPSHPQSFESSQPHVREPLSPVLLQQACPQELSDLEWSDLWASVKNPRSSSLPLSQEAASGPRPFVLAPTPNPFPGNSAHSQQLCLPLLPQVATVSRKPG